MNSFEKSYPSVAAPPSSVSENMEDAIELFNERDFATVMSVFRNHGITCQSEHCSSLPAYLLTQTHVDKSFVKAKPGPYCFKCSSEIAPKCSKDNCFRPCKIRVSAQGYSDFCKSHEERGVSPPSCMIG